MRETFKDLFIDMLKGDLSDIVICIMLWALTIVAIAGIGWLLFISLDKATGKYTIREAVVISKFHTNPSQSTTYVKVGNVLVPATSYYGGRMYLNATLAGERKSRVVVEVNSPEFSTLETGDSIRIYALRGGVTGNIVEAIFADRIK